MTESSRRKFLHDLSVGLGTAAVAASSPIPARASGLLLRLLRGDVPLKLLERFKALPRA